ncbi:MAG: hypothetical protein ACI85U_003363 [Candidatus Promineifilaceae bacterium]|jgi:hypothetical protein
MDREDLIEKIRVLPDQIAELVVGISEYDLTTHFLMKADGSPEWTVAQNVHHLADSHMNSYIGFKMLLSENHPTILAYDENVWAAQPESMSADISHSLGILKNLHARWAIFFENLSEADWKRTGFHTEGGDFSLENQFKDYVEHGESHVDQIQRTLAAR